jgi:integrase
MAQATVGLAILSDRPGELFALRWKDVNEQTCVLTVREAVYDRTFDTRKTVAGARQIPLSEAALNLIVDWKAKAARPPCLLRLQGFGTPECPVVDPPAHLLLVGAREGRARQSRRAVYGPSQH